MRDCLTRRVVTMVTRMITGRKEMMIVGRTATTTEVGVEVTAVETAVEAVAEEAVAVVAEDAAVGATITEEVVEDAAVTGDAVVVAAVAIEDAARIINFKVSTSSNEKVELSHAMMLC